MRLSRNNCIINVESKKAKVDEIWPGFYQNKPLYVSSFNVSNSAIASSKALKIKFCKEILE